jgi:hypothetical protein
VENGNIAIIYMFLDHTVPCHIDGLQPFWSVGGNERAGNLKSAFFNIVFDFLSLPCSGLLIQ